MAKRLKSTLISSFLFAALCVEIFSILPKATQTEAPSIPLTVEGAIHVHTPMGLKTHAFDWMKDPAKRAGIDFVVAVSSTTAAHEEGRYGDVDFFIEDDVKLPAGEVLTFHSHGNLKTAKGDELKRLVLEAFEAQAGSSQDLFSVISHPSHVRTPWNRFDRYTDGIEILNLDSQWVREFYDAPLSFLGSLFALPFNQFLVALKFLHPYSKDLVSWDNMNSLSPGHFGIVGHDLSVSLGFAEGSSLHASLLEKSFRVARNVLFLKDPPSSDFAMRQKQIYSAIREGRLALVFSVLYPFTGNDWLLDCDGVQYRSGQHASLGKACRFRVKTPRTFPFAKQIKLFRNGELVNEFSSDDDEYQVPVTEGGIYRLEIWARTRTVFRAFLANDTPYVLYNPIYLN